MVCLGNICRSPTAEGVLRFQLQAKGLQDLVHVDSAGTSDWHEGEAPDPRSIRHAAARGYDLSTQRSRPIVMTDFHLHDYILAMDKQNLRDLQRRCPPELQSKLGLLLSFTAASTDQVPDPYEQQQAAFEEVLDLCEQASAALIAHLVAKHRLQPAGGMA